MKNKNLPIILLSIALVMAGAAIFAMQNKPPETTQTPNDAPSTAGYYENEAGEMVSLNEGFYQIKDPITKETLNIDGRLYSSVPNNTANEQRWSADKQDFMTLVTPQSNTMPPYYIDAFEGLISSGRAWSTPGQMPTDRLRHSDADQACKASGKRLCSETEWRTACRGGYTMPAKFNNLNEIAKNCDVVRKQAFTGLVSKTDAHPDCSAPGLGVYNMIGNVSEFVNSDAGQPMIVGLSFEHGYDKKIGQDLMLACEKTVKAAGTYRPFKYYNYRGFRCCKDAE